VVLSDDQVALVAAFVDRPENWSAVEGDVAAMERFTAFEAEVERAYVRRMLWAGLVAVAAGVGGWLVLSGIAGAAMH
jgi:hypothetical protein